MTPSPLRWGGGRIEGQPHVLTLGDGEPVAVGGGSLGLGLTEQLRLQEFDAHVAAVPVAYSYTIQSAGRELLAFHWHPVGPSPVRTPHLHVHADVQVGDTWLKKAHLPTGIVAPQDVLWLLLAELGARSFVDDWRSMLERSR